MRFCISKTQSYMILYIYIVLIRGYDQKVRVEVQRLNFKCEINLYRFTLGCNAYIYIYIYIYIYTYRVFYSIPSYTFFKTCLISHIVTLTHNNSTTTNLTTRLSTPYNMYMNTFF